MGSQMEYFSCYPISVCMCGGGVCNRSGNALSIDEWGRQQVCRDGRHLPRWPMRPVWPTHLHRRGNNCTMRKWSAKSAKILLRSRWLGAKGYNDPYNVMAVIEEDAIHRQYYPDGIKIKKPTF